MYRRLVLIFVFALVVPACGSDGEAVTTTSTIGASVPSTTVTSTTTTHAPAFEGRPVIVDTDMAAEGIMSILYLLAQDDLSVRAITVSGTGLVHCDAGVEQALGLVELAGTGGVPVACGPEDPIEGFNTFPSAWRAGAYDVYGLELPEGGEPSELTAPELIVSTVTTSSMPVVIYADGPQTNLAAALRLDPSIVENIERVFIMGGALDVPGTVMRNPDAEWNIWVDPAAADEVLASGIPVTLVPLDATNQVPLTVFHLDALEAHAGNPPLDAVVTMLQGNEQISTGGLYFWDQLLAALIVDGDIGASETLRVAVTRTGDRSTSGSTVRSDDGHEVDVVLEVDRAGFEQEFLSALAGEPVDPIEIEADWVVAFGPESTTTDLPEGPVAPGEYTMMLSNEADSLRILVVGWLTGDATLDDLESWEGIEQPPFYEVLTTAPVSPGAELVVIVTLAAARTHNLVELDPEADVNSVLGVVEVSG